jgi:biopolymer transport protein ExbD
MAISGIPADEEDPLNTTINTTPLVDVMLVMLIIFLITIPVVINNVQVELPKASNIPNQTKPENIVISVVASGTVYWKLEELPDRDELLRRLLQESPKVPQPEIHIRADKETQFQHIGKVIIDCQRAGIVKISFVTDPEGLNVKSGSL